jgi:hypothetical protein
MTDKIKGLQNHISERTDVQEVWFNENGEWSFAPCNGFPIKKTVDEVMAMGTKKDSDETKENNQSKANAKK